VEGQIKAVMANTLEDLGIPKLEFYEFIELILRTIPNRESPILKAKMRSIELNPQIGGYSSPVSCKIGGLTHSAGYLIKYPGISVPEPRCDVHMEKLVIELESKTWIHFGIKPIEVENYTEITKDVWPGVVRARIAQIKKFAIKPL
jgi:hypothetical protein